MREQLPKEEIERARNLAESATKDAGDRGFAAVAEQCGLSRSAVSMFVRKKYPAEEYDIARKVLKALDGFLCPYANERISLDACRSVALAEAPTHNPFKLAHWQACLCCLGRPVPKKED